MRPADIFNETKGRPAEGQRCPSAHGFTDRRKGRGPPIHRGSKDFFRTRGKPESGELTPLVAAEAEDKKQEESPRTSQEHADNPTKREEVNR